MKLRIKPIVTACALAMTAGQAGAVDVYLAAKPYLKNLPDGSTVPMWGYVLDADVNNNGRGDCWQAPDNAARQACVMNIQDDPAIPGPQITIPADQSDLRIFLSNGLPEPTSIVIPGQKLPFSQNNNGPTWFRPSNAANPIVIRSTRGNRTHKMRSYGREAAANGGRQRYFWTTALTGAQSVPNPIEGSGTLIYHTGTHPQKQLYMGLYGTLIKDAAVAEVYPGVSYQSDTTLFYSDIDPDFNKSVVSDPAYDQAPYAPNDYTATHTPLETAIERHPSWFLVNGQPYQPGTTPDITGLSTNQSNLIRFASATTEKHVPVLQGLYGAIHGEDAIQYNWQEITNDTLNETPAPIQQYSIGLPPLKTKDVIINPTVAGRYAIYDGNGYMTNPSDPDNDAVGDTVGGMLRFLNIAQGANQSPVTVADQVEIPIPEVALTPFTVPVEVDVLANDFDPEGVTLGIPLDTLDQFTDTNVLIELTCSELNDNCTATATVTDPWTSPVMADLTYTATDFNAATTDTDGTITITLVQNMAPVPADDTMAAATDAPLNFNLYADLVLPNDTDADDDVLSVTAVDVNALTDPDAGVVQCLDLVGGECTYTPPNPLPVSIPFDKTFTYTVSDGVNPDSAPVTVTINVNLPGNPALALDDSYVTDEDTLLSVPLPGVLGNDTDSVGGALAVTDTAVLVADSGPANAVNFIFNNDGSFEYEPATDFNGQDSFHYIVNNGVDSLPATVIIDVAAVNDPPVAMSETYTMAEDGILGVPAPGILGNDSDVDNDQLTAILLSRPSRARPGPCPSAPSEPDCFVLINNGSFHYEPDVNFNGVDSFTYEVSDGTATSGPVSVTIAVTPQNDAPLALNDTFILKSPSEIVTDGEGRPLTATFDFPATPGVLQNDIDDTQLRAVEVNDTDGVSPSVTSDGATSVTIDNNAVGTLATLEYTAIDTTDLVSNVATAEFIRLVTISMAEYRLNEDLDPANDDWRIRGSVDTTVVPPGSQVHAFLVDADQNETEIVSNAAGNNTGVVLNNGDFRINTNNQGPEPAPGDSIRVEVRYGAGEPLAGDLIENATYGLMPVYILQ
jgi:hypothetical protein